MDGAGDSTAGKPATLNFSAHPLRASMSRAGPRTRRAWPTRRGNFGFSGRRYRTSCEGSDGPWGSLPAAELTVVMDLRPIEGLGPAEATRRATKLRSSLVKRVSMIIARLDCYLERHGPAQRRSRRKGEGTSRRRKESLGAPSIGASPPGLRPLRLDSSRPLIQR
jgi:hypothetical protein